MRIVDIKQAKNRVVLEIGKCYVAERHVGVRIADAQLLCETVEYLLKIIEKLPKPIDLSGFTDGHGKNGEEHIRCAVHNRTIEDVRNLIMEELT